MNIKGFKAKNGTVYKYDYDALANKPEIPENPDSGGNADQSGGLSTTASELLITILRNGVYSADQSANITALAAELAVTEEEEPDTPVEPDEPVTPDKTLSSISATYSGGDVAVGTAVTALTGIVVTAHYSDGSTETVTGYTLSGTIAEGSNTVTVTYQGKTTTFSVIGIAESGGGGEIVELSDEVTLGSYRIHYADDAVYSERLADVTEPVSVDTSNLTMYSDAGETAYTGNWVEGTCDCVVADKVFDADTEVKVILRWAGAQIIDKFAIGCTDWDGTADLTGKIVYNCQSLGSAGWKKGNILHEITMNIKAGTRLFVANANEVHVHILPTSAVINDFTTGKVAGNASVSSDVFETDTKVKISCSADGSIFDYYLAGCTHWDGTGDANNNIFYNMQECGTAKWVNPLSSEATYIVKAGYRLYLACYFSRSNVTVSVEKVV